MIASADSIFPSSSDSSNASKASTVATPSSTSRSTWSESLMKSVMTTCGVGGGHGGDLCHCHCQSLVIGIRLTALVRRSRGRTRDRRYRAFRCTSFRRWPPARRIRRSDRRPLAGLSPSSTTPAFKSMSSRSASNSGVLVATLMTGVGLQPKQLPRPVVNITRFAPPATFPVTLAGSKPGESITTNPRDSIRSAYS